MVILQHSESVEEGLTSLTILKVLYNDTHFKQVSFNQNLVRPSIINKAITSVHSADLALTHYSSLLKHFLSVVTLAL